MKSCVIIGAAAVSCAMREYAASADYIIAADAGYANAQKLGITPDLYVGDFDTLAPPSVTGEIIKLAPEKDDTDIMYAARMAIKRGYKRVTILGGMGGRLDHTIANMQVVLFLEQNNVSAMLADEINEVTVLLQGKKTFLPRSGWYISAFPVGERACGITLRGLKYPLNNATLTNAFPIGISNEYQSGEAEIEVLGGGLYIIHSRKA